MIMKFALFLQELTNLNMIFICEFCLKYVKSNKCLERHIVSMCILLILHFQAVAILSHSLVCLKIYIMCSILKKNWSFLIITVPPEVPKKSVLKGIDTFSGEATLTKL